MDDGTRLAYFQGESYCSIANESAIMKTNIPIRIVSLHILVALFYGSCHNHRKDVNSEFGPTQNSQFFFGVWWETYFSRAKIIDIVIHLECFFFCECHANF